MLKGLILFCCIAIIFAGCTPATPPDAPDDDGGVTIGEAAIVEGVDVLMMESFPIQVRAVIYGNLRDGCTEIIDTQASRTGQDFNVKITTSRPTTALCTAALEPFEVNVTLDVLDLPAGTYTVEAYGKTAEFTFTVTNSASE